VSSVLVEIAEHDLLQIEISECNLLQIRQRCRHHSHEVVSFYAINTEVAMGNNHLYHLSPFFRDTSITHNFLEWKKFQNIRQYIVQIIKVGIEPPGNPP
jgi:hypothetical protein